MVINFKFHRGDEFASLEPVCNVLCAEISAISVDELLSYYNM